MIKPNCFWDRAKLIWLRVRYTFTIFFTHPSSDSTTGTFFFFFFFKNKPFYFRYNVNRKSSQADGEMIDGFQE